MAAMPELPSVSYAVRLSGLWAAWLLVMLFHVELGLMPLFHGLSVEIKSQVAASRVPRLFLAMLFYFLLPVGALLVAIHAVADPGGWSASSPWRGAQFLFSVVYSITNVIHLIADIRIPDSRSDQVILMTVLTLIGLLINQQAWAWWQG
ncbi:hypothetical protein H8F25_04785 [Synechococcus sp. CBW1004]|nr:hypothetical protein H8F25_04785 [Synechococcus sp. CBW1004]